ncbi:MAG: TSUP family transporter [Methylobacteriaceae bacterium]|nr:TSUP family transporter [Methylobacteriaceae bacterium]
MTASLAAFLALVVLGTSFLSGVFGMAGGLVLLGALLLVFDVAPAQILFGATQFASNGWRAVLWRAHVRWDIVWRYVAGSLAAFAAMGLVAFIPDKGWMYVGLGATPFLVRLLPKSLDPDIERPGAPYLCGAVIMVTQLLAGAAGNVLDLFFQRSSLDRKAIVATKAVTQTAAHALRVAYFGAFAEAFAQPLPWWVFAGAIAIAMLGNTLAARVLHAMSDAGFRRWSWRIIAAVSLTYLARGLWMVVTGSTT